MNNFTPTKSEGGTTTQERIDLGTLGPINTSSNAETSARQKSQESYGPVGKTMPDLIYPFSNKLNIYIIFATLIFISALTTGHLTNHKDFCVVIITILILWLIIFCSNYKHKKSN